MTRLFRDFTQGWLRSFASSHDYHGHRQQMCQPPKALQTSTLHLARFLLLMGVSINRRWDVKSDVAMRGKKGPGAETMTDQTETTTGSIVLEGEVGPRDAAAIHGQMMQTLEAGRALVVDTSGAASVHVAILQLLVAGAATARSRQSEFTLIAPPDGACRVAFDRAGLAVPEPSPRA